MQISYREAVEADFDSFYKIKCDEENVKWSGFETKPEYTKLKDWFAQQLFSVKRKIYIVFADDVAIVFLS